LLPKNFQIALRLLLLLLLLTGASYISFELRNVTNSLLLYLPNALSIVLVHWLGWRILPLIYANGVITLVIWGAAGTWLRIGIMATHEPVVALVSWFLYTRSSSSAEKGLLLNTDSFLRFIIFGIAVPITVNSFYVYHYSFIHGDLEQVFLFWLSDFITIVPIAMLLIYFLDYNAERLRIVPRASTMPARPAWGEIALATLVFVVLSFIFPFDRYWFIYGIGATLVSLRRGFETALIMNIIIFMLNYLLPLLHVASPLLISYGSTQFVNVHLGMSTMMFMSVLVGRVVSDLAAIREKLRAQKVQAEQAAHQLSQVNRELDRFVYSVSHDLSAPLKSIKGLVAITRMEPQAFMEYLGKIEKSVDRLEDFIGEVLDYSRTNRKELVREEVLLPELVSEINDKFHYLEGFEQIRFEFDFGVERVVTDRFLLRIALSNLMSNAIKYQKHYSGHDAEIRVRSFYDGGDVVIEIIDNGEGIDEEVQDKIFNMFYRGTLNSSGAGLGLYIAREAVQKLDGRIGLRSQRGKGSAFSVHLKNEAQRPASP
jgi:two-component system, sensor histidine kinase